MQCSVIRVPTGGHIAKRGQLFGVSGAAALVLLAPEEAAPRRGRASALQVTTAAPQEQLLLNSTREKQKT